MKPDAAQPPATPENLIFQLLPKRHPSIVTRYGVTALLVGIFVLLQAELAETFSRRPFLLFILPVFLSSLLFNRGSGYIATALSLLAARWLFLEPTHSLMPANVNDASGMVLFAIIGICIATLTEALRKALEVIAERERERSLLLLELNHRIRNDLQMVGFLLKASKDMDRPREALDAAADRVAVMGEVYSRLTSDELSNSLNAEDLIEAIVSGLRSRIFGLRRVNIVADIEPVRVTTRCATALGLIVNELVTNALKHAFPDDREGAIHVALRREAEGLRLTVADDGIGKPETGPAGFGTTMVRQMARQNGGSVSTASPDGGLVVTVSLPSTCLA